MKKLPIGIQTFSKLIKENCVYVDKTALIHQLITQGSYYFLARPRRFGKSLLVSILEALFSGDKNLFEGYAIASLHYNWEQYPVIKISFSDIPHSSPETLDKEIRAYLQDLALKYDIILTDDMSAGRMLRIMVMQLSKINLVVLLIDEYDYAILKHVHNPETAEKIRDVLKNFYDVIKGLDQYLKFVLLTGVSQFSKTSIFSGLNNLEDISLSETYNSMLGYTRDEIEYYFKDYLDPISQKTNCSIAQLLDDMTTWYDGYRFCRSNNAEHMFNPFSVLLYLKNKEFSDYWFETGTPTFLINLLKNRNYPLQEFENCKAIEPELRQFDVNTLELKTLMFQAGYLTIKEYTPESRMYRLGYPNKETIDALGYLTMQSMTGLAPTDLYGTVALLSQAFANNTLDALFGILTTLYASIPYTIHIKEEKYYQTIFYIVLKMLGAEIIVEQTTNIGRIDAVLTTNNYYFIIEFKINAPASQAITQIEEKKYYQPYQHQGKKIILVGIAFDTNNKNINEILYKTL